MPKFKIEYSKVGHLLSEDTWQCVVTDRKTDLTFIGLGDSRKEAQDDAFDEYYKFKKQKNSYSYLSDYSGYSSDSKPSNQPVNEGDPFVDKLISYLAILLTIIFTYYIFKWSR